MINDEDFFKIYFKTFLTENLDLPLIKILKLMDIDKTTFYNRFSYYENFVEKAFDYYFNKLTKERIRMRTNDLFEIIEQINTRIIKNLMHSKTIIDFNNFSNNINLFYDQLKKRYKLLILNEIIAKTFLYKNKKMSCEIVLEEAFFSLIIHIKNKELSFSNFYLISN